MPASAEPTPASGRHRAWYEDAVIYQLHVRSFADSNADGTGDFDGLTSRLSYLVDLGVDTLWLLPFYVSPLRDDGYDIADYHRINPVYGDMASFRRFLRAAHDAGLRVVIELVLNHTSDAHEWFQRARTAPRGSRQRNYYVWSDTADRYSEARVIFQDFESSNWTWDPVAKQYFWHRFYSHQPDLNFESADVRRAMVSTLDRWFRLGVDGVRLDAVPYLFEQEGTNCENLERTHQFLKELRRHVDEHFPGRMLLAEANQWPEDAVAYFGDGDECHMAFHFPVMPRLFMAVQMESRTPVLDILEQTPDIPPGCQWAMFLRNHDELTLEMVTDEERDYMYRRFAGVSRMRVNLGIRRRLAPLLDDDRRRIELMNALLFALPGTPIIYYGDEIGMGDNVYLGDRDAVRTPMQWSADRNAGFSKCNPQQLFLPLVVDPQHHFEAINVEAQRRNPASLWWWMRRLITLRRRHHVFGSGTMEVVDSDNPRVLTFLRTRAPSESPATGGSTPTSDDVLIVANLSRHAQHVSMTLPRHAGSHPVELFGQSTFDPVSDGPYRLTLGPHDFFWLRLGRRSELASTQAYEPPLLHLRGGRQWTDRATAASITRALPDYLAVQRWFHPHRTSIGDVRLVDCVPVPAASPSTRSGRTATREASVAVLLVRVDLTGDEPRHHVVAFEIRPGVRSHGARRMAPISGDVAAPTPDTGDGALVARAMDAATVVDVTQSPHVVTRVAKAILRGEGWRGADGELVGRPLAALRPALEFDRPTTVRSLGSQVRNVSSVIDDRVVVKVYRRVERGPHPEAEMLQHLATVGFANAPTLLGTLEYRSDDVDRDDAHRIVVASLLTWVPSDGDARSLMLDDAARFLEAAAATVAAAAPDPTDATAEVGHESLSSAREHARLLGEHTALLHLALSHSEDERFVPQPLTRLAQRSLFQSMRNEARAVLLPIGARDLAERVVQRYSEVTVRPIECDRVRTHGHLYLDQILTRAGSVTFIDFEGNSARALGERSIKRSVFADVATMIRSFHHVAERGTFDAVQRGIGSVEQLLPYGREWAAVTSDSFLRAYLQHAGASRLVPDEDADASLLLHLMVLRECVHELRRALRDRPERTSLPLEAIESLLAQR